MEPRTLPDRLRSAFTHTIVGDLVLCVAAPVARSHCHDAQKQSQATFPDLLGNRVVGRVQEWRIRKALFEKTANQSAVSESCPHTF